MVVRQAGIFGEYKQVVIKKKSTPKKRKNEELKQKINILYNLYQQLYEKQNISLLEPREVIIKGDIIVYPQDRQAEPIEIIKMNVLDDIDKRIEVMEKTVSEPVQLQFDFMKEFV